MSWSVDDVPDLAGRVAVVTGANGGLGFETARVLVRKGARVVMAVRSPEKGGRARASILGEMPGAALEVVTLDTSSLGKNSTAHSFNSSLKHVVIFIDSFTKTFMYENYF